MGTTLVLFVTTSTTVMKCLILLTLAALASCDADADALYATYGAALRYPYAYAAHGYAAPIAAVRAAPVAPIAAVRAAPVSPVAGVRSAAPSVTSSQYHAQDEDKNFSFGYSNINSARQESGNANLGVVQGSYTDGRNTIHYVADAYGYRSTVVP